MGKSRQNKNKLPSFLKDNPSQDLIKHMKGWQNCPGNSIDEELSEEEIRYVKTHMTNSITDNDIPTGHLTRVERAYHFTEQNLKEGDTLNTNSIFRAFSREPDATNSYMIAHIGRKEPIVIYRTQGNTPHYNITKHTHDFTREKESWVETGKLKIDKITHYTKETHDMRQVMRENLNLKDYPRELEVYSDEYIEKYDFDPTPQDVIFVDVSYTE